jgi:hypothetical protein
MSADQIEDSLGESPKRVTINKEVEEGAIFWLVNATPEGEIYSRKSVLVVKGPYCVKEHPLFLVDFKPMTSVGEVFPMPLLSLGIKPRRGSALKTGSWLEPYKSS